MELGSKWCLEAGCIQFTKALILILIVEDKCYLSPINRFPLFLFLRGKVPVSYPPQLAPFPWHLQSFYSWLLFFLSGVNLHRPSEMLDCASSQGLSGFLKLRFSTPALPKWVVLLTMLDCSAHGFEGSLTLDSPALEFWFIRALWGKCLLSWESILHLWFGTKRALQTPQHSFSC